MRRRLAALGVYFFTCSVLFGQTVSISDHSPDGTPVSITGTVTFQDSSNMVCSITGHNDSPQSIIASSIELKLTKPTGEPGQIVFERDYFFKSSTVSPPQSDFLISDDCRMGKELNVQRTPQPPQAHAKVVFLQFEDGSIWGDPKVGAQLMAQRVEVLAFLKWLKSAYSTDGPDGLDKALAKDQKPGTRVWARLAGLRTIRASSGISAVAETIDQNLATAEERKTWLR
jgi:hypothetical protein